MRETETNIETLRENILSVKRKKRSYDVRTRLTEDEKERVRALTKALHVSESDLLRYLLNYAELVVVEPTEDTEGYTEVTVKGLKSPLQETK